MAVMAEDVKNPLQLGRSNDSTLIGDILMKLHVHHQTMVIFIQYYFDKIPFI